MLKSEFSRLADGRRLVHVTGERNFIESHYRLIYEEPQYMVYWDALHDTPRVFYISGADFTKARRTGAARLPIKRITRHLWASRMSIYFSKEMILSCIAQLRTLQQKAWE